MSIMTSAPTSYKVGDYVQIAPSFARTQEQRTTVFQVTKEPHGARGVNYTIQPTDGTAGFRAPAEALTPYKGDASTLPSASEVEQFTLGTLVKDKYGKLDDGAALVVVKVGSGKVNLARLGGNDGRYFASVPTARLVVVDASKVTVND